MSCKYNNSMHTIEPEEVDVCFDEFEQLLLSEDYESQEELNHRLNEEYFQVYELTNDEMLEFARAGASLKLLNKSFRCFNGVPYERRTQKWEEWGKACIA